jgi:hypothetical protein
VTDWRRDLLLPRENIVWFGAFATNPVKLRGGLAGNLHAKQSVFIQATRLGSGGFQQAGCVPFNRFFGQDLVLF